MFLHIGNLCFNYTSRVGEQKWRLCKHQPLPMRPSTFICCPSSCHPDKDDNLHVYLISVGCSYSLLQFEDTICSMSFNADHSRSCSRLGRDQDAWDRQFSYQPWSRSFAKQTTLEIERHLKIMCTKCLPSQQSFTRRIYCMRSTRSVLLVCLKFPRTNNKYREAAVQALTTAGAETICPDFTLSRFCPIIFMALYYEDHRLHIHGAVL